jgi:hypothetical protein
MAVDSDLLNSSWVQTLIAIAIAIVSGVAVRLGWAKGSTQVPDTHVEMADTVVVARAVKTLVDALDFALDRVTDLHDMRTRTEKSHIDEIGRLRGEIRDLNRNLQVLIQKENLNGS